MDFCEENPQLLIRNHMNSNKGKFQFHVKSNVELSGSKGDNAFAQGTLNENLGCSESRDSLLSTQVIG